MRKLKQLFLAATISLAAIQSQAAFVVKQAPIETSEKVTPSSTSQNVEPSSSTEFQKQDVKVKKQSALKKLFKKGDSNGLSKTAYIILAILSLGWLAMGILDDFSGSNWLIALLITFGGFLAAFLLSLFIPILPIFIACAGIVWAFVKMKDYYN